MGHLRLGDRVRIVCGGWGAYGCNDCEGVLTDKPHTNGCIETENSIRVKIDKVGDCCYSDAKVGDIWRISLDCDDTVVRKARDKSFVEKFNDNKEHSKKYPERILINLDLSNKTNTKCEVMAKGLYKTGESTKRLTDDYEYRIGAVLSIVRALEFDSEIEDKIIFALHNKSKMTDEMLSEISNEQLINELENRL